MDILDITELLSGGLFESGVFNSAVAAGAEGPAPEGVAGDDARSSIQDVAFAVFALDSQAQAPRKKPFAGR